jgi:hypothetical protein
MKKIVLSLLVSASFALSTQCARSFAEQLITAIESNRIANVQEVFKQNPKVELSQHDKEAILAASSAQKRKYKHRRTSLLNIPCDYYNVKHGVILSLIGVASLVIRKTANTAPAREEEVVAMYNASPSYGEYGSSYKAPAPGEYDSSYKAPAPRKRKIPAEPLFFEGDESLAKWIKRGLVGVGLGSLGLGLWKFAQGFKLAELNEARAIKTLIKKNLFGIVPPVVVTAQPPVKK